jgi:hypothetical protein
MPNKKRHSKSRTGINNLGKRAPFDIARIISTLVASLTNRKEVIQCLIVYRRKARLS